MTGLQLMLQSHSERKYHMIIYSTKLPMKAEFDRNAFLASIVKWNANSKYRIDGLETQIDSPVFEVSAENNSISSITLEGELTTAVRVHNENKGGIWNTDLILNEDKNILTICVDRSVQDTTELMKGFAQVPKIVEQLILDGFTGSNLGFQISKKAISICSDEKAALNDAFNGKVSFSLPIVYLSSRSKLDSDKLASKLAGLATVIQDNEDMISEAYPEPIYIFFPHRNRKPQAFGDYPLHRDISFEIIEHLNNQLYTGIDTWNGVKSELLAIEAKQNAVKYQEAATENEVLSEMQEEFLKQEQANIAERERLLAENLKLQSEMFMLTKKLEKAGNGAQPILNMGAETDFYPGEHLEFVIEILRDYYEKSVGADSTTRRHDVLKSILDANPAEGILEKYRQLIKNAFEGYRDFNTQKIKSALREAGIEITAHSGHYKLALHGDSRYTYEVASTPGAYRTGINTSAGINKLMF